MRKLGFALLSSLLLSLSLTASAADDTYKPERLGIAGVAAPFSLPVPGKYGAVLSSRFPSRWQVEASYSRGSTGFGYSRLKLLSLREENFTLRGRRFFSRSFNTSVGLGERRFTVETMPQLSRYYEPQSAIVRTPFLEGGVGSEWRPYRGMTIGLEWFGIAIPIGRSSVTERGNLLEDEPLVDRAFRLAGAIPGGRVLTVHVGWVFYDRLRPVKAPPLKEERREETPLERIPPPEENIPEERPFEDPSIEVIQTSLP